MKKLAIVLFVLAILTTLVGCTESVSPQNDISLGGSTSGTGETISTTSTTTSNTTNSPGTIAADKLLSRNKAKEIALDRVGVNENAASRIEIDLDYDEDSKTWKYEVDFYVDSIEHEVDINAETGDIILYKKDVDVVSKASKTTKATTAATTTGSKLITKEKAKQIALKKAGVKESDISQYRIKADFDDDRNRWEYEIDFNVGKVEYDLTIEAVKGTVIEFEREDEEEKRLTTVTTKPTFVSKEKVKALALLCSGVSEDKISKYEVELDFDDDANRWEYEVSFEVGRIEYDLLVDAITGELIRCDKEIDD